MRLMHLLLLPGTVLVVAAGFWSTQVSRAREAVLTTTLASPAAAVQGASRMNGSQPLLPPSVLTLAGTVLELQPGAPLTVTATVGSKVYPATVSGHSYSVRIGRPSADDMVVVEAWSPRVHYRSFVGSVGRLRTLAGPDSTVVPSESPSVQLSPYGTALTYLVRRLLSGRDASSDEEFERMTRVAASSDLEYAAYALAAIAKEQLELPAGFADGYALLRNRVAFSQVSAYATFRYAAEGYLFDHAQQVAILAAEGLPDQLAFVDGMPRDQLPIHPGDVFLLARRTDGDFDLDERVPLLDPVNRLEVDAQGRLQLTPLGSQVRTLQKRNEFGQYEWFERTAAGRTLKRLTRGDATSVWVMRSVWNDQSQEQPAAPAVQEIEYHVLSSTELAAWSLGNGWSAIAGSTVALPWMCSGQQPDEFVHELAKCGLVEHGFEADGAGQTMAHGWKVSPAAMAPVPPTTGAFQWSAGLHGALDITDSKVSTSFWRLQGYPAAVGPVFYRSTAVTGDWAGRRMVGIDMAATKNVDAWEASAPVGDWQSGVPDPLPHWYTAAGQNFSTLMQRLADGTGAETYATNQPVPVSWQGSYDAVFHTHRFAFFETQPTRRYVDDCETALASGSVGCYTRVRYFKPIYRTGSRYYGIQDLYAADAYPDSSEGPPTRTSMLVYYDCRSGQCTSAGMEASSPNRFPGGSHDRARGRGTNPAARLTRERGVVR